jgi:hypothetical protein
MEVMAASASGAGGEARRRPLLSIEAAADVWGRSRSATYEAARRGELPGLVRINNRLYVRRAVLERWLDGADEVAASGRDGVET